MRGALPDDPHGQSCHQAPQAELSRNAGSRGRAPVRRSDHHPGKCAYIGSPYTACTEY